MGKLPLSWQLPTVDREIEQEAIEGETVSARVLSVQVEMPSRPDAEWGLVFLRGG